MTAPTDIYVDPDSLFGTASDNWSLSSAANINTPFQTLGQALTASVNSKVRINLLPRSGGAAYPSTHIVNDSFPANNPPTTWVGTSFLRRTQWAVVRPHPAFGPVTLRSVNLEVNAPTYPMGSYMIFRDLTFQRPVTDATYTINLEAMSHVYFVNCSVLGGQVQIRPCLDVRWLNCTFIGASYINTLINLALGTASASLSRLSLSQRLRIQGCTFTNVGIGCIQASNVADLLVDSCRFSHVYVGHAGDHVDCISGGGIRGAVIRNNLIGNFDGSGGISHALNILNTGQNYAILVYNNILLDDSAYGMDIANVDGFYVCHNTVSNSATGALTASVGAGLYNANWYMWNNVFDESAFGVGNPTYLWEDYNLFTGAGTHTPGPHSVVGAPTYVGPTNTGAGWPSKSSPGRNFTLASGSRGRAAGLPLRSTFPFGNPSTDVLNVGRPVDGVTAPDMGALVS